MSGQRDPAIDPYWQGYADAVENFTADVEPAPRRRALAHLVPTLRTRHPGRPR